MLIVIPQTDNFDDLFGFANFVHHAVLDVYSPGISTFKISNQLLIRRRVLVRICFYNFN